jgi:poly(3-hydroxybutyrate) depolymerase
VTSRTRTPAPCCDPEPTVDHSTSGVVITRWSGCDAGTAVELWTLPCGSHEWPRQASPTNPGGIDATEVVLDFFHAHGPGPTG